MNRSPDQSGPGESASWPGALPGWLRSILLSCAAAVLAVDALFGAPEHPHFWWERIPGRMALLGFLGSWLLYVIGKAVLKNVLQRPEEYYAE